MWILIDFFFGFRVIYQKENGEPDLEYVDLEYLVLFGFREEKEEGVLGDGFRRWECVQIW